VFTSAKRLARSSAELRGEVQGFVASIQAA
jgi:hypothetical protein